MRSPRSVLKNFLIFLSGFNVIFKTKQNKKGHHADGGIFCSDFMLISKKGPSCEFCKFSTCFMQRTRARRRVPQLSTAFSGKQKRRFLAGEKTPEFAKIQCENAGKNFAHFCAYREHCLKLYSVHKFFLPAQANRWMESSKIFTKN